MSVQGAAGKPTLVFIHGFLGRPADWDRVVERLSGRYRCLLLTVPDRDAQGQPLGDWQGLIQACEHHWTALLPHRFTLIGYSLGGRIALALSQTWLTRLEALVLESAHPGLSTASARHQRREQDRRWADALRTKPLAQTLDRWYRQRVFACLSNTQRAELIDMRRAQQANRLADLLIAASLAGQPDYWTQAAQLPCPLLYISGTQDAKFCALAQYLADRRANLIWQQMPNSGHNCHHQSPQVYADFLSSFLTQVLHD